MKPTCTHAVLLFLLYVPHYITDVESWSNKTPTWRHIRAAASTAAIVTANVLLPFPASADTVFAANAKQAPAMVRESPAQSAIEKNLLKNVKAPTEERPQIRLPANVGRSPEESGPNPIVQGLVYLADPTSERRPGPMDTLVLTAASLSNPNQPLAGAKVPISKTRLPMTFRMFRENVMSGKVDEWLQVEKEQDIFVTARICPEGAQVPCSDQESTLKSYGVSKLVRGLPGVPEGVRLRAAASLPLQ